MKRKRDPLPPLDADIIKESMAWVHKNEGMKMSGKHYPSPRISSELPDCSMPLTFDQYNYCSLGCLYCFAYFFKSNNPAMKDSLVKDVNIDQFIKKLQGKFPNDAMYNHFYKKEFLLHWGGLADPFCNFENTNKSGTKLIEALSEMNYPTLFSFKGDTVRRSKKLKKIFSKSAGQSNFAFQISMVTNSDEMAKRVEIGVPSTTRRLETLKMLSDMGYWTILRLRPFIIGITDQGLEELLYRALEAGINAVSVEFFALDCRMNKGMQTRYDWLSKLVGTEIVSYYKELSPSERGGYQRLNRLVKEEYIKIIYKFCAENDLVCGISDPDFKELNTSGSCCGMPDNFEKNNKLENWSKDQLTYHIKQARKLYHKKGKIKKFYFNKVYKNVSYIMDKSVAQDHPSVVSYCNAERHELTLRDILQKQWNNLRSSANPRNYFHGKLEPLNTLDDDGNLVYKYVPMEYEAQWKKEGIDLTR